MKYILLEAKKAMSSKEWVAGNAIGFLCMLMLFLVWRFIA